MNQKAMACNIDIHLGHKRRCPYKECVCDECMETVERQKVMAKEVADTREQALVEEQRGSMLGKVHEMESNIQPLTPVKPMKSLSQCRSSSSVGVAVQDVSSSADSMVYDMPPNVGLVPLHIPPPFSLTGQPRSLAYDQAQRLERYLRNLAYHPKYYWQPL